MWVVRFFGSILREEDFRREDCIQGLVFRRSTCHRHLGCRDGVVKWLCLLLAMVDVGCR